MIRWPRPTVRLRLTLTYTALFIVAGAALLSASYILVQRRENGPATAVQIICTKQNANGQAQRTVVTAGGAPGVVTLNPTNCPNVVGAFYHSFGAGETLARGRASGGAVPPGGSLPAKIPGPTAADIRQLTATVKASQAHTLHSFKVDSALALALLAIASFGLSWWMAGRALRPVHRITDAARRLSEWTLHDRINLQGPDDELKQLADTFDAMLGRLDRAFQSQRRFAANASHELRTPLATERVLIDEALANRTARPDELRTILQQLRVNNEETERLIDALLLLARSERGIEQWSTVDLSDVLSAVIEQSAAEATTAQVTISANAERVEVSGDPGLLERLAGNLVENAIRYNVPSGTAAIAIRRDQGAALLEVTNTGPVIEPGEVAGLLEPFRRAGPDRTNDGTGVGLGLSIVDAIVNAHRGTMTIRAPNEGGLHVRVQLPIADASESRDAAGNATSSSRRRPPVDSAR
jgi:signal transduction histidine kinase